MTEANDPFDLQRFVDAQANVYEEIRAELTRGRKTSHWIWFAFPQIAGLGMSATSRRYAIGSLDEARAYLEHPILGARLRQLTGIVLAHEDSSAPQIFGALDAMKFRSCMTLFASVDAGETVFEEALEQFFAGEPDARTLSLIRAPE